MKINPKMLEKVQPETLLIFKKNILFEQINGRVNSIRIILFQIINPKNSSRKNPKVIFSLNQQLGFWKKVR